MIEGEYFSPAECAYHSASLVAVASKQVLLVGRHLQASQSQTFGAVVGLELVHQLNIIDLVLRINYLINLHLSFKRTLPYKQMVAVLSKGEVLGVESVWVELMHTFPVLWPSLS